MIITEEEITHLFNKFNTSRVLVIGDVMVDSYLIGKVDRISPEAPVPVVWVRKESYMPGGASNVANNLSSLGGRRRTRLVHMFRRNRLGSTRFPCPCRYRRAAPDGYNHGCCRCRPGTIRPCGTGRHNQLAFRIRLVPDRRMIAGQTSLGRYHMSLGRHSFAMFRIRLESAHS